MSRGAGLSTRRASSRRTSSSFASRHLTTIEINGTFYRTQSAASFKKWRDETPDDFVFSVKGHRAVVNSRKLAQSGEPVEWFFKSGVLELGEKLGPISVAVCAVQEIRRGGFRRLPGLLPRRPVGGR